VGVSLLEWIVFCVLFFGPLVGTCVWLWRGLEDRKSYVPPSMGEQIRKWL
jgi:hypothetical protein